MAKQNEVLEWQVLLSDAEWGRQESLDDLLGEEAAGAAKRRLRVSHVWTAALVALLVIGTGAWMLYREAQSGLAEIEGEIVSAVEAETWRERANRDAAESAGESAESAMSARVEAMVDRQALADWQGLYVSANNIVPSPIHAEIQAPQDIGHISGTLESEIDGAEAGETKTVEVGKVSLRTGLAMVEVTTTDALGNTYRETQFYREAHQLNGLSEWQRTSAQESFWGAELHFETTYFHFRYRIKDAEAVEAVAARLDAIYAQLRDDVGLPFAQDRLEIAVLPELPSGVILLSFETGRLEVGSPKLLRIPVEMSDGAALLKSIVHPLVTHVTSEAIKEGKLRREWAAMLRGLQLWQIYVGSGLPVTEFQETDLQETWYRETVAWLYDDAARIRSRQRNASTEDLHILCREFYTWRHVLPNDLSLPAVCLNEQREATILSYLAHTPERLDNLLYRLDWDGYPYDSWYGDWARRMAAATVIDYAVETYGRDSLPVLVEGFRTHSAWETLIPDLLGVPVEEFEAGWLESLPRD